MMTVIMNPAPDARAMSRSRFLSIMMFPEYLVEEESSSDVMRSIIAVTASQRLMSDVVNGNCIF